MRPIVEILRIEEDEKYGTFGFMRIQKEVFCATLEPVDNENQQRISSIPVQQYTCKRINSPKFGWTFEITNVPGRTHVLFHKGNTIEHTLGCTILGKYHGILGEKRAVLNSGNTFKAFMNKMAGHDQFKLTVTEHF